MAHRGLYGVMQDFDEFVAGNLEQLLKTAYLITWDGGEAEDLVQECLFKVARRWPRVRGMAQPRAYARRILVNLALDAAGGRARRRGELDGAPAVADEPARDLLVGLETRAELLDALERLTPRQRAVLGSNPTRRLSNSHRLRAPRVSACAVSLASGRSVRRRSLPPWVIPKHSRTVVTLRPSSDWFPGSTARAVSRSSAELAEGVTCTYVAS